MSDENCLFCKIFSGEIPAQVVARSEHSMVFWDRSPLAPTHLLAIPKRHAANLGDFAEAATGEELLDLMKLASAAGRAASPTGYRIVANEGNDAGQTVYHLHVHVLAGRALGMLG